MSGRRVIFEHANGIRQIAGVLEEGEQAVSEITCPFVMLGVSYAGAKLSRVTDRAVYYVPHEK